MPRPGEFSPTPSVLMELREEREVVREGYRFLDEKRLLLAAEILRQLETWTALQRRFAGAHDEAAQTLGAAVERHGLEGLQLHPAPQWQSGIELGSGRFLGVPTRHARLDLSPVEKPAAVDPSPEADRCGEAFRALLDDAVQLAALSGNLERLLAEYRRTARRARALEDVILPELEESLAVVTTALEEGDQEDAIRVRLRAPDANRPGP